MQGIFQSIFFSKRKLGNTNYTIIFAVLAIQWEVKHWEDVLEEYQIKLDSRDKSSICKRICKLN